MYLDESDKLSVALSFCKIVMILKKYPSLVKKFRRCARLFEDENIRCYFDVYYQDKGILPLFLKIIFPGTRFYFREGVFNFYWEWACGVETFVIKSKEIRKFFEGSDDLRRLLPEDNAYLNALISIENKIYDCFTDIVEANTTMAIEERTDNSGVNNRFFFIAPGFEESTFQFLSHFFQIYDLIQDGLQIIEEAKLYIKEAVNREGTQCVA